MSKIETTMKAYNQAFLAQQWQDLKALVSEDIVWLALGQQTLHGWQALLEGLQSSPRLKDLVISEQFISEQSAAQFGQLVTEQGEAFHFADRYVFTSSGKICQIESLVAL